MSAREERLGAGVGGGGGGGTGVWWIATQDMMGDVPIAASPGGTTAFLRADGQWANASGVVVPSPPGEFQILTADVFGGQPIQASPGGTGYFLRADGTWAAVAGVPGSGSSSFYFHAMSPLYAETNVSLTDQFTASGGTPPYSYAQISGSVPAGTTFSTDGILSGTPTAQETSTIEVQATDSAGNSATSSQTIYTSAIGPAGFYGGASTAQYGLSVGMTLNAVPGGTVLVVLAGAAGQGFVPSIVSVTGTNLTFQKRAAVTSGPYSVSGYAGSTYGDLEEWWAAVPALNDYSFTITYAEACTVALLATPFFGANVSVPWDADPSVPAYPGGWAVASLKDTAATSACVLAVYLNVSDVGGVGANTAADGYLTQMNYTQGAPPPGLYVAIAPQGGAFSGTFGWPDIYVPQNSGAVILDALQGA